MRPWADAETRNIVTQTVNQFIVDHPTITMNPIMSFGNYKRASSEDNLINSIIWLDNYWIMSCEGTVFSSTMPLTTATFRVKGKNSQRRPISLLPTVDKLFEIHINQTIIVTIKISYRQFGFRSFHSTEHALKSLNLYWIAVGACLARWSKIQTIWITFPSKCYQNCKWYNICCDGMS